MWREERFGDDASTIAEMVRSAIAVAHEDALAAHRAGHMIAHDAYGNTMKVRSSELLAEFAENVSSMRVQRSSDKGRFPYAVVESTDVRLWPLRIGKDPSVGHEALRLRTPVSDVRRGLLKRSSRYARQLSLDSFIEWDPRSTPSSDAFARTAVIAFGSNPKDGVWDLGWGDLELVDPARGGVVWHHWEALGSVISDRDDGSGIDVDEDEE